MAFESAVGTFTVPATTGTTVTVSGLAFAPKAVILWMAGNYATTPASGSGAMPMNSNFAWLRPGAGFFTSTTARVAFGMHIRDNVGTTVAFGTVRTDACLVMLNSGADYSALDVQSMNSDGFTLVTESTAPGADYHVSYLALGGSDITHASVGTFAVSSGTGNQSLTGVGFRPDGVLLLDAFATANAIEDGAAWVLGALTGASNQWTVSGASMGGVAATTSNRYMRSDECYTSLATDGVAGTLKYRMSLVSIDSDGITVNRIVMPNANNVHYLALKGCSIKAGTFTYNTSGAAVTGVGFTPKALLVATHGTTQSTAGTAQTHHLFALGAATSPTSRATHYALDVHAADPTNCLSSARNDALIETSNTTTTYATNARMDLTSLDSGGFTYVGDVVGSVNWLGGYVAFGDGVGGGASTARSQVFVIG